MGRVLPDWRRSRSTADGRIRVLLWLKSRLYSRQSGTGANVRYLAGNLNFCKSGYAALPKFITL